MLGEELVEPAACLGQRLPAAFAAAVLALEAERQADVEEFEQLEVARRLADICSSSAKNLSAPLASPCSSATSPSLAQSRPHGVAVAESSSSAQRA